MTIREEGARRKKRRHYPIASSGEYSRTEEQVTEGVSPKAVAAAALPLLAGVILLVADKWLGADVDDTVWTTLLLSALPVGGSAAVASPGRVRTRRRQ